jgi:hypothetical protein
VQRVAALPVQLYSIRDAVAADLPGRFDLVPALPEGWDPTQRPLAR